MLNNIINSKTYNHNFNKINNNKEVGNNSQILMIFNLNQQ